MDPRFQPHNSHRESPDEFAVRDPNLRNLNALPVRYRSPLLDHLQALGPGVYSLTGGRQVGKTTLLKQWMDELLRAGVDPGRISYFAGELIDDHHSLIRLVREEIEDARGHGRIYLVVDEITYVRDWDKGIKFLVDAGLIEDVTLVFSGSDSVLIREARMRFPGRRGESPVVDFHLDPLSFREHVDLAQRISMESRGSLLDPARPVAESVQRAVDREFGQYLAHGGYLRAINDMARHDTILPSTFATYSDWIRGDLLKRGKQEHYLREVLGAIDARVGSQVSWNSLARALSIAHPSTVADYVALLASMDAVFVQPALLEDKLTGAPRKDRRVMFTDPFIWHAVRSWLRPDADPYHHQVLPSLDDPEECGRFAEACAVTHVRRFHPTYYIKAAGEVDIAWIAGGRFHPIEVKWTGQLRPKDLRQITKYPDGTIWSKSWNVAEIQGVPVVPLPLALYRLGAGPFEAAAAAH